MSEKIAALQKEAAIEIKIQQGLERIVIVKGISKSSKKKSAQDADVLFQLEKSVNRLDALKNEMQKRKVQLQALQAKEDLEFNEMINKPPKQGFQKRKIQPHLQPHEIIDQNEQFNQNGRFIQVVSDQLGLKTQAKQAVFISQEQSTKSVIQKILQTMNIPGVEADYCLTFVNVDHSTIFY